jgi:hypothetical protein
MCDLLQLLTKNDCIMLNRNVIEGVEGLRELIMDEIREHLAEECEGGPVDIDVKFNLDGNAEHLRSIQLDENGKTVLVITDTGVNELFLYSIDEMVEIVDAL